MFQYLPFLMRLLTPATIAFLTPDRSRLLFKAVVESIDVVAAKLGDKPLTEQAKEFEEALSANLDVVFSVIPGFEDQKAEIKARLVPWLKSLIYGNPEDPAHLAEGEAAPDA
jgi:hypothetical protein